MQDRTVYAAVIDSLNVSKNAVKERDSMKNRHILLLVVLPALTIFLFGCSGGGDDEAGNSSTTVASQVGYYTINDGAQYTRSLTPTSMPVGNGTVSQTINADGSVTFSIINSSGYSDDGFYFAAGAVGNFNGLNISTSAGSDPISVNIWFDVDGNGEFFVWNGNVLSGLGSDAYILGPSSVQNVLSVNANTNFTSLNPGGGSYTLAQLKSGAAPGITNTTKIALWVGIATNGGSLSATVQSIEMN